jgi:hypothetical protein
MAEKQHADVQAYPVDKDTIAMLNALHQHPMGSIVWEQTRYEQDA